MKKMLDLAREKIEKFLDQYVLLIILTAFISIVILTIVSVRDSNKSSYEIGKKVGLALTVEYAIGSIARAEFDSLWNTDRETQVEFHNKCLEEYK